MRGLVEVPSLRLAVVTRGLVILPLVARTQGLVVPSWRLVAPCIRVAHGHRLRARLVLESLRVVARLELAPSRRQRRAAAAIFGAGAWTTGPAVVAAAVAVVTLAAVWPPVPGIRSYAIFVIVMAAVILAPSTARLETAVAVAAASRLSDTTDHSLLHTIVRGGEKEHASTTWRYRSRTCFQKPNNLILSLIL